MKKIYLSVLFFLLVLPVSINADEIDLSGNLSPVTSRSLIEPVQAFITSQFIEVDFNASLGAIDLSICDEAGNVVYQQTVVASAGHQLLIDISSLDEGVYTIALTNSQTNLSGEFEI